MNKVFNTKLSAWVFQLKKEISNNGFNGEALYLCDDDSIDFLTNDIQSAEIIWDKEKQIMDMKNYDKYMIEKFGEDSIRNFGWEHISKHFDFVEVEVEVE